MMGCMAKRSQVQLSPFCLAKVGLATSLPGPPWLPLLHLGIHPPMQLLSSAAAMQDSVRCQCHLVAGAQALLASHRHPQPPMGALQGLQGYPHVPLPWLALGSEWWGRLLWGRTRSMPHKWVMGWPHSLSIAASGGIKGCTQRWAVPVGRWPSAYCFVHGIKWCLPYPACPACCQGPALTESPWRGKLGLWGSVGGALGWSSWACG